MSYGENNTMPLKKNPEKRKKCWIYGALTALLLFSLVYRLYLVYHVGYMSDGYTPDEGNYIAMAQRLVEQHVYSFWGYGSDAYVSPGFPLFLAAVMRVFGTGMTGIHAVKVIQAVLSTLTILLSWILSHQLTRRYTPGFIAVIALSLFTDMAIYSRYLLTETLYFFTMMLFFVVFAAAAKQGKRWMYALSGVLFCVTVMVRPMIFALFPILFLAAYFMCKPEKKHFLQCCGCFLLGFIVTALPWWIRNVAVLGQFVLFATQSNPLFAGIAENTEALGSDPGFLGCIKLLFVQLWEHPLSTLRWMLIKKFYIIFNGSVTEQIPLGMLSCMIKNFTVMMGFSGTFLMLLNRRLRWPAIALLFYVALSFVFVPTARYAVQYIILLSISAGYLLSAAAAAVRKDSL